MCYSVHDERKVFSPFGSGFFPISTKHNAAGSLEPWLSKKDGGGSIPSPSHIAGASASAGSRSQAGGDDFSAPAQEVEPSGGGERGGGPQEFSALGPQIHSDTGPGDDSTGTSHLPRDGGPIAFIAGLFAAGQR